MLVLTILQSLLNLFYDNDSEIKSNVEMNPYVILMILYAVGVMVFTLPLLVFHIYLIASGSMTTYEYFRGKEKVSQYQFIYTEYDKYYLYFNTCYLI